jgi:hypothetical protein
MPRNESKNKNKNKNKRLVHLKCWNKKSSPWEKQAYLVWLQNRFAQHYETITVKQQKVKKMVKAPQEESWDNYISSTKHDEHGCQLIKCW